MNAVRARPRAKEDLVEIWTRLATGSSVHADRYLDILEHRLRLLKASPALGSLRPDLSVGVRAYSVDDYVIFYRATKRAIEIIRVLHYANEIEAIPRDG